MDCVFDHDGSQFNPFTVLQQLYPRLKYLTEKDHIELWDIQNFVFCWHEDNPALPEL
jgi:hypothetical protein